MASIKRTSQLNLWFSFESNPRPIKWKNALNTKSILCSFKFINIKSIIQLRFYSYSLCSSETTPVEGFTVQSELTLRYFCGFVYLNMCHLWVGNRCSIVFLHKFSLFICLFHEKTKFCTHSPIAIGSKGLTVSSTSPNCFEFLADSLFQRHIHIIWSDYAQGFWFSVSPMY